MQDIYKSSLLYDFYGELLTEHQKEVYEDYVLNDLSLVDRAYEYFYVNFSSFNSVGGFSTSLCVRRNMSKSVSDYLSKVDKLFEFHNRLSSVIIENRNIIDLIEKYDNNTIDKGLPLQ